MRLKKIVLNGFKSFADKTEFPIDASITAIVGPNGCGKSNVVDAVKWVLGEQKVKSLRSDQMTDVIFSGSGTRKALNAAEVSLVFTNPEEGGNRSLSVETDEVQITRKVYRTGDSEYRINGKKCRLKDIRDILMDTGVGTKAYSIIEQGQIDKILGATKTDRRAVFEEAAGISKFKAHKNEALRKLERTEQNLLRLADILDEVAKRLRSVKLQAGKARNYLQYTHRLKELQVNYSLVEYARQHEQLYDTRKKLETLGEQFAGLAADVSKTDAVLSEMASTITEKEHALSEAANTLVSVQSKIEQKLQQIEFLRHRIEELTQRRTQQRANIQRFHEQTKDFEADLARYSDEQTRSEALHKEKSLLMEELQEVMQEIDGDLTMFTADLDDEKSGIIDIVRRTAQLHNEVQSMSHYRDNLASQKDRLATRADAARAELEGLLTERAQHQARQDDIAKILGELEGNLSAKREQIESLETNLSGMRQTLSQHKEQRSGLSSELSVLTDMERRNEGVAKAVRRLLKENGESEAPRAYIEGLLADKFRTDMAFAKAAEAALDGLAEAVVVNDMPRLLGDQGLSEVLSGRVRFVEIRDTGTVETLPDAILSQAGVIGRLVDHVQCEPQYHSLVTRMLGRTLVVQSLEVAHGLISQVPGACQCVTQDGQCLQSDGVVQIGPLGKASGLISRKSRMVELQTELDQLNAAIADLEARIQHDDQARQHLSKLCQDLRTAIYEANTEKTQIQSKLAMYEQNINRLAGEQPLIAGEMDQLQSQIQGSVQKEYESKQKLEELEIVNNERSARISELESQIETLRERRQIQMSELTEVKVELGQISEQNKAAKQILASIHHQVDSALHGSTQAQEEITTCTRQIEQAEQDILSSETLISEMYVQKEASQTANRQLKEDISDLRERFAQAEQSIRSQRNAKTEVEQQINDLRVTLGQLEVKQQDLVERVKDELQIDLEEAHETYTKQDMDWDSVREEINDLRSKIERLGNVNVDAIEEQEALEERHEFLSKQVEDLDQSKVQLQQLITKLNKTSREKFAQAFEEIRGHFQLIFRKLFGGGKADLILEEADDILEAGIEVIARPPGKETRSISLLSGGEKSMTALALQFAVFRTKPSPFCFLDEVDAALDEANNERFNLLIKEFNLDTQFIVITHAKRTMSIADVLFGVTMQTQGVSKKISVRFDDYDAQTEEEEAA
ncbi:MAG: chromosome segregation protein SMC [Phycisphaerae bacterium]|nr:chromosome segregation protein SMC [Phycisphaerae bacterium]